MDVVAVDATGDVRAIRRLVAGEARVPIDTGDPGLVGIAAEGGDELAHRLAASVLVALPVLLKPCTLVMEGKLLEEREGVGRKAGECRRRCHGGHVPITSPASAGRCRAINGRVNLRSVDRPDRPR